MRLALTPCRPERLYFYSPAWPLRDLAVELGDVNVGLQVLVEGLAQHLLIEANAVEPGPDRRRPPIDKGVDRLRELEERRQGRIFQLRWAHAGDGQRPGRWNDVRRDAAAQIDPLDFFECFVRQNGRKL